MKKSLLLFLMIMAFALPAMADLIMIKPHTFQDAATATGNGTPLAVDNYNSVGLQVTIADTATVTFEATQDGTTWASIGCTLGSDTTSALVTSATATGAYSCNIATYQQFRARISAHTGGAVTVTGRASTAVVRSGGGGSGGVSIASDTDLPATCTPATGPNAIFFDSDDNLLYFCSATDTFTQINPSEAQGLDDVIAIERTYGSATSQATGVRFGSSDAGVYVNIGYDATLGAYMTCEVAGVLDDCDKTFKILSGKEFKITDASGNAMLDFAPNAATAKERWAYGTLKPLKYVFFPAGYLVGDGTNCPLAASAATINSGPKTLTMICGSGGNGDMDFDVVMSRDWDGDVLYFEPSYTQTAANTSAMNSDIKAQCRGAGETPSSTWGTAVAIDDAAVTGSSAEDKTLSAAVTPAGTCSAGDHLFVRYTLDVTGTTTPEATLNFYGIGMYYSASSGSN